MRRLRHFSFAFLLAAMLALGQYAAVLHGLGHATEHLSQKPGTPAKTVCDQCFTCSQLSSAAPSMPATLPVPLGDSQPVVGDIPCGRSVTDVVFLSRGPPVLS